MTSTSPSIDDIQSYLAEEPFVRTLARSLLLDEQHVDDVVQQTWLEALRRSKRAAGLPESLRGWLASVVRSRASNVRRARARRDLGEREAAVIETLPSASDLIGREELRRQVVEAVAALPEPYRVVVLLRYFEQEPPRRIAQRLGIPVATAKTRLKRALASLRERLDAGSDGDRRRWQLALVPIAAPHRSTLGTVLAMKWSAAAGLFMAFKHVLILLGGAFAAVLFFSGDPFGTADRPLAAPVEPLAAEQAADAEPAERTRPPAAEPRAARAPVAQPRRSTEVAPSVRAAQAGFRGRVILPDGAPAAGQLVRVLAFDPVKSFGSVGDVFGAPAAVGPRSVEARADENGSFELVGVPPQRMYALHAGVDGPHPRLLMLRETPGPGQVVDLGVVALTAKGGIAGRVVDPDGEPVAFADVWAADVPGALLGVAPVDRLERDGSMFFSLPDLPDFPLDTPEGAERYHEALRSHTNHIIIEAEEDADFVVLEMPSGLRDLYDHLPVARARTDEDGRFELAGLTPGGNALVVRAPGFESGGKPRVLVRADEVRDVGDVRLSTGESVEVQVVDRDGKPAGGAEVRWALRPPTGMTGILFGSALARTAADGRYVVRGLPRRAGAMVAYRADGSAPWTVAGPFEGGETAVLELPPARRVDVVVRGGNPDVPLGELDWRAWVGPPLGELNIAGINPPFAIEEHLEEQPSEDPRVRRFALTGLPDGLYTLAIRAPSYAAHCGILSIDGERSRAFDIELVPATSCALRVVDLRGAPVHGAEVYVQSESVPAWSRSVLYSYGGVGGWSRLARAAGTTDELGRLELEGLPVEPVAVVVRHPEFGAASLRTALPREDLQVVLEDGAAIEGRLSDRGRLVDAGGYEIVAERVDAGERVTSMPDVVLRTRVGDRGRFLLEGLPSGRYRVEARPVEDPVESFGKLLEAAQPGFTWGESHRSETIDLRPGDRRELAFDLDPNAVPPGIVGARVSGTVTVDGRPAAGLRIEFQRTGGFGQPIESFAKTDASGHFERADLKPQLVRLWIRDEQNGTMLWSKEIDIREGDDADLSLALETGAVRVAVVDGAGNAVAGCTVSLRGKGEDGAQVRRSGPTNAAGVFEVRVPVGTFVASVVGPRGQAYEQVVVAPGARAVRVDLALSADGMFAGRVVGRDPEVAIKWLSVRGPGERSMFHMTQVDDAGRFVVQLQHGSYRVTLQTEEFEEYEALPAALVIDERGALERVIEVGAKVER